MPALLAAAHLGGQVGSSGTWLQGLAPRDGRAGGAAMGLSQRPGAGASDLWQLTWVGGGECGFPQEPGCGGWLPGMAEQAARQWVPPEA